MCLVRTTVDLATAAPCASNCAVIYRRTAISAVRSCVSNQKTWAEEAACHRPTSIFSCSPGPRRALVSSLLKKCGKQSKIHLVDLITARRGGGVANLEHPAHRRSRKHGGARGGGRPRFCPPPGARPAGQLHAAPRGSRKQNGVASSCGSALANTVPAAGQSRGGGQKNTRHGRLCHVDGHHPR